VNYSTNLPVYFTSFGSFMRKIWAVFFVLAFLLLSGCQTTAEEATETEAAVEEKPAATPVQPTEEAAIEKIDYCMSCHTDKEKLITTAKVEEEVAEEESSGVG
jgi:hypothetical protein